MKIFVIGGKARSGKNTFGNYLKEELKNYGYNPCVMRITEPLYSYANKYFEWRVEENNKPREFLQKMGIEIIQKKLNKKNFLLNRLYEDIEILSNFFDAFIITDARLINEFTSIKEKYSKVITIKIERDNFNSNMTAEQKEHITEKEIETYNEFNYIVENKSLNDLKEAAKKIIIEEK